MLVVGCSCGAKFKAKEENAGKKAKCPKCGLTLIIGASSSGAAGSVAAPAVNPMAKPRVVPASDEWEMPAEPLMAASAPVAGCPSCGAAMSPGAVLCVACGYNTQTGKALKGARAPSAAAVKAGEAARAMGTFMRGVIFSGIGASLGAGLWILVGYLGDVEIGYVAWALGVLAGIGMIVGARDGSMQSGLTAAGISFVGIVAAKIVLISHFLAEKMHIHPPVGELIGPIIHSMFNPLDLLFAGLAMVTAFRIGSGSRSVTE